MLHLLVSILLGFLAYVIFEKFIDDRAAAVIGATIGILYFTSGGLF